MLNITDTTLFLSPQNKLKREERKAEQIRQLRSEIVPPRNGTDTQINEHLLGSQTPTLSASVCALYHVQFVAISITRFRYVL